MYIAPAGMTGVSPGTSESFEKQALALFSKTSVDLAK